MAVHKRFSYIPAYCFSLGLHQPSQGRPQHCCLLNSVSKPCVALLYGLHSCPSFPTVAPVDMPTPPCLASFVWSKLQVLYNLFFLTERLSTYCKEEFKLQENAWKPDSPSFDLIASKVYDVLLLPNVEPSSAVKLKLALQCSCDMQQKVMRLFMIMKLPLTLLSCFFWCVCFLPQRLAFDFDPKSAVFKERVFVILLWFPRPCCSGSRHPNPLCTKICRSPLSPPTKLRLSLDDNTSTGQICILPWCRRWSVKEHTSLIWGRWTCDLSSAFHFWLFNCI